jgi:multiple antibiotic resistance protein
MSVAITIGSRGKVEGFAPLTEMASRATGALLGMVAIGLSIYLAYRFAASMAKFLGDTGLEVLVRLSAFILMCIGIEIIWNGWTALNALH